MAGTALAQCPDGAPPPCRGNRAVAPPPTTVAVLNFENRSRDTSDAFLAEGLAEEISTRLGQVDRLTIVSRSQVRRLPSGADLSLPALGRALGAVTFVTGAVQGSPSRLRVTVSLIRAANAVQLWATVYDRPRADLLEIQEDIATRVATAIAGALRPAERRALQRSPTRNPQALEHIMRGNVLAQMRSTDRLGRAILEYRSAVALDPGSAQAHARLAWVEALCTIWSYSCLGMTRDSLLNGAQASAQTSLRLDSTVSDAWLAQGEFLLARSFDPRLKLAAAREAVRHDSLNADAWHQLGVVRFGVGDDSGAMQAYRRALELDPNRAPTYELMSRVALAERRFPEARALLDSASRIEPDFSPAYRVRAVLAAWTGDTTTVAAQALEYARLEPGTNVVQPLIALGAASAGDSARANRLIDRLLPDSTRWPQALWFALWKMGRFDDYWRIAQLRGGQVRGAPLAWWQSRLPWFDPIRDDPRMKRIIDSLRIRDTAAPR